MNAGASVVAIELLYLDLATCDRCRETDRNLETAIARIRGELEAEGLAVRLDRRHVRSEAEALALGMEISPTIRVNGHDIQPGWAASTCGACSDLANNQEAVPCRVWQWQGDEHTAAPVALIAEAIKAAAMAAPVPSASRATAPGQASEPIRRFFAGAKQCCASVPKDDNTPKGNAMKTLEVFDPAMCCATGVCGVEVDPVLAQFAADLQWLGEQGVAVSRHNLGQEPAAFAANPAVVKEMEAGLDRLPILVVDGHIVTTGLYPSRAQLAQKLGLAVPAAAGPAAPAKSCCAPKSGCC